MGAFIIQAIKMKNIVPGLLNSWEQLDTRICVFPILVQDLLKKNLWNNGAGEIGQYLKAMATLLEGYGFNS